MNGLRAARPTRQEIAAAQDRTIPDVIAAGLRVLFCGINPARTRRWLAITSAVPAIASGQVRQVK